MTNEQWEVLLAVLEGKALEAAPVGFIIDSPWLPGWAGISTLDYYTNERMWFEANLRAAREFPEAMFLPGFWAEYGMCTEPSAFGVRCSWESQDLPYAHKMIESTADIDSLVQPDPRRDGLGPFVLSRLAHCRAEIESAGHAIRFAVARGPLNVASFLMGSTEFLITLKTEPDKAHALLKRINKYLVEWLRVQKEAFDTIDGIFVLDDIVGFCGEKDFKEFALPYLKEDFAAFDASVRFFHNDAAGKVCAPHLPEIRVNLFNFSFEHSLAEMKDWTGGQVGLLGNIPPRDVLANGNAEDVDRSVREALAGIDDRSRLVLSCGGGMPQTVSSENIRAFIAAARS
ncbi:MAG: uroporphyrinogen decarboxylase family protein [Sedimentisphaerales bacterium]|nr:uroporphyrinogen decarboxylase family protein [Sedimentisphaerales bacterium]